ncbi:hypothetical protein [Variovorax sp. HJSM1_2]|uniref:hypothetical protein n=1 Tax=Variovorax sp. HJSM1_2 TaxID=3366263 RepID=UPI003BF5FEE3
MFLAVAVGGWHIRSVGLETGVLEFGGKAKKAVLREVEPAAFAFWESFFFWQVAVCSVFGVSGLVLSWRLAKRSSSVF